MKHKNLKQSIYRITSPKISLPIMIILLIILVAANSIYTQSVEMNSAVKSSSIQTIYFSSSSSSSNVNCGLVPNSIRSTIEKDEPWYCPINNEIYKSWSNYLPIAVLVVLVALFIDIILFALGVVFRSNRIRNLAVGELYEVFASGLIIFLFLYISAVTLGLVPGIYVGNINPYATAFHLMDNTIDSIENLYSNLFFIYVRDRYITSISITAGGITLGEAKGIVGAAESIYGVSVLTLELTAIEPAAVIMGFLSDGLALLYSEYYLLIFFSVAAIPVFIIPGVVLRILTPTRGLGGMMIAFGIAFFLVVPTLFAAAYYFSASSFLTHLTVTTEQSQQINSQGLASARDASASSPASKDMASIESSMASFWLMVLFYPAMIIAVTYAFVQTLAQFISGSGYSSGRMRGFI